MGIYFCIDLLAARGARDGGTTRGRHVGKAGPGDAVAGRGGTWIVVASQGVEAADQGGEAVASNDDGRPRAGRRRPGGWEEKKGH